LAQLSLQSAESARQQSTARAALAAAVGVSLRGISEAKFDFAKFTTAKAPAVSRRAALTHRADVLSSLAAYAVAEARLRLEVAKQYPDIHLNPGYQLDAGENKWTVGIGLTLPLLSHNEGAIAEAEAKRREAAAQVEIVQARALAEYERSAAELAAARQKLAAVDNLLDEQLRLIEVENRALSAGSGDQTSLLSAKVERSLTLISRVDAIQEVQSAIGALEDATQTPAGASRP
jgi:outer membrane protein TolC